MVNQLQYALARRAGCTATQALAFARNAKGCHLHGMWARQAHDHRVIATVRRAALRQQAVSLPVGRTSWAYAYSIVREEARLARLAWLQRAMEREPEFIPGE